MININELANFGMIVLICFVGGMLRDYFLTLNPRNGKDETIKIGKVLASSLLVSIVMFLFGNELLIKLGHKIFLGVCFIMGVFGYELSINLTNPKKIKYIFKFISAIKKGAVDEIGKTMDNLEKEDKSDDGENGSKSN